MTIAWAMSAAGFANAPYDFEPLSTWQKNVAPLHNRNEQRLSDDAPDELAVFCAIE
jgi:hypothetical protein